MQSGLGYLFSLTFAVFLRPRPVAVVPLEAAGFFGGVILRFLAGGAPFSDARVAAWPEALVRLIPRGGAGGLATAGRLRMLYRGSGAGSKGGGGGGGGGDIRAVERTGEAEAGRVLLGPEARVRGLNSAGGGIWGEARRGREGVPAGDGAVVAWDRSGENPSWDSVMFCSASPSCGRTDSSWEAGSALVSCTGQCSEPFGVTSGVSIQDSVSCDSSCALGCEGDMVLIGLRKRFGDCDWEGRMGRGGVNGHCAPSWRGRAGGSRNRRKGCVDPDARALMPCEGGSSSAGSVSVRSSVAVFFR